MTAEDIARELLNEEQAERPDLRVSLFDKQREFIDHESKRKIAVVGRRGGKSTIAAAALAESGIDGRPGVSFYCGITRERAKSIMWGPLKAINEAQGLGLKMNDSELIAYGPNEARIQVTGADKMKEADKKKGDKYKIAIVDEAQLFEAYLAEMADEVITPALMDYDAPFWLLGTPNPSCLGYFHDAATILPGWELFTWTALENPYMQAEEFFKKQCELYGLSRDDPKFQREYLARWVRGGASLLYKFDPAVNTYEKREENRQWFYVIGVDLGWHDDTAFVVWAYEPGDPNLYEVESFKAPHMLPDAVTQAIAKLRAKYSDYVRVIVDTGGLGKMIAEGLRERFGQYVTEAKKTEKLAAIELMNGDLKAGRIKLRKDSPIIDEWQALHLTKEGQEDATVPNHLADAALYGYRYCQQYLYRAVPITGPRTEQARVDAHFERLKQRHDEAMAREQLTWGAGSPADTFADTGRVVDY